MDAWLVVLLVAAAVLAVVGGSIVYWVYTRQPIYAGNSVSVEYKTCFRVNQRTGKSEYVFLVHGPRWLRKLLSKRGAEIVKSVGDEKSAEIHEIWRPLRCRVEFVLAMDDPADSDKAEALEHAVKEYCENQISPVSKWVAKSEKSVKPKNTKDKTADKTSPKPVTRETGQPSGQSQPLEGQSSGVSSGSARPA